MIGTLNENCMTLCDSEVSSGHTRTSRWEEEDCQPLSLGKNLLFGNIFLKAQDSERNLTDGKWVRIPRVPWDPPMVDPSIKDSAIRHCYSGGRDEGSLGGTLKGCSSTGRKTGETRRKYALCFCTTRNFNSK